MDKVTLLTIWGTVSAQNIFPETRIRILKTGFEACFLVSDGNPLEDFWNVKEIKFRMKQRNII